LQISLYGFKSMRRICGGDMKHGPLIVAHQSCRVVLLTTARGSRPPTIKEYARLEHDIVSGDDSGFCGFVDDILKDKSFTRRVGVSVQFYSVVPLILSLTNLVCTLPPGCVSNLRSAP
jgi:hypothetical protein